MPEWSESVDRTRPLSMQTRGPHQREGEDDLARTLLAAGQTSAGLLGRRRGRGAEVGAGGVGASDPPESSREGAAQVSCNSQMLQRQGISCASCGTFPLGP